MAESALRTRLGIPPDAETVLVIGESTHWDPNWLFTSEQYWRWRVRRTLERAVDELVADERRVFGIECIFFLRMFWERCPERRPEVRNLVNSGRIQLTGTGVTTPDTLLPRTEALMRDFLVGQEWLRANGMTQEPRLAYFPDCFGHSPALPSLLTAMGFDRAAITRIDGMFFPGCDWELPGRFPRPGSGAEMLGRLRGADFVWRDGAGAEVLCHWNAFGYGQAELLAHRGVTRATGLPFAVADRSEANVARRIDRLAADLVAVSATPYLFAPMGYDFSMPLRGLVDLLDRYNSRRYGDTGTWVLCAGLDDHLSLVDCRRSDLPVVQLDPNPYWSGFYTSRPTLKRACFELADDLLCADALAVAVGDRAAGDDLAEAWYTACVSNHHDWVTGTSPDRVVEREQMPWLERAAAQTAKVSTRLALRSEGPPPELHRRPPDWRRVGDGGVEVVVGDGIFAVDPCLGGSLTENGPHAVEPICPGSFQAVLWADEGGLWRMGMEFAGGRFAEVAAEPSATSGLEVVEVDGELRVGTMLTLGSASVRRELVFRRDLPGVVCRTESIVPRRHTLTLRLRLASPGSILMDCPGGEVRRPLQRWYRPTFWPLHSWARIGDVTLASERPTAVAVSAHGTVEVVAARNATHERAFGLLPIPGMPAPGHDDGAQVCELALLLGDDCRPTARRIWPRDPAVRSLGDAAANAVQIEGPDDVEVLTVKWAHRGEGVIVRLAVQPPWGRTVRVGLAGGVSAAYRCDARERDMEALGVTADGASVVLEQAITTLRLIGPQD